MGGVHDAYDGDVDVQSVVPEMQLHSVQPVNEDFITGEVVAEVAFGQSITIIWVVVNVQKLLTILLALFRFLRVLF